MAEATITTDTVATSAIERNKNRAKKGSEKKQKKIIYFAKREFSVEIDTHTHYSL